MLKNYFLVAIRNLRRNKAHSIINIAGLAVGMAIAILIGLWITDELEYDHFTPNIDRIAQVRQSQTFNGVINTGKAIPIPLAAELKNSYGSNFKHIVLASWNWDHILTVGDRNIRQPGNYMQPEAPEMFSLKMLAGNRDGLHDPTSVLLSQSAAKALFGTTDPLNKNIRIDNARNFKVAGIYEDIPYNSSLRQISFIAPWDDYAQNIVGKNSWNDWGNNSYQLFVQLADNADMNVASARIHDAKLKKVSKEDAKFRSTLFLQPMNRWHLYDRYTNGVSDGGAITYVWLFGIIGIFVLLLACINFMNLSTARSEKRAREVGIRKAIGSLRIQLIIQFFSESVLIAVIAFAYALILVFILLPIFNELADKKMSILWGNAGFWASCIGFTLFTGLVAGSYPALYLSGFRPVKVLKGAFKAGPKAAIPRKVLVVLQFSVSVILIIGTVIVFKQIQYAKDRPVGYTREGLLSIEMPTDDLSKHFEPFRAECKRTGLVSEVSMSTSSTYQISNNSSGLSWKGKDPNMSDDFATIGVTPEFGQTAAWQLTAGRDFSRDYPTDSTAIILTEAAVRYMNLSNPVGETIKWFKTFHVIGVVKDMVIQNPYEPVKQTVFYMRSNFSDDYCNIRIAPGVTTASALTKIEEIYKRYAPGIPLTYKFADDEFARKFTDEVRIGKLAAVFAILAIFISCLGLFGMASFMAEQKVKEIGVRKVLGASVFNLWSLLSKDFLALVIISLFISIPLAWMLMSNWLTHFAYRSGMPWWIFAGSALGAVLITLLTISFQGIRAALANPVRSLRSE